MTGEYLNNMLGENIRRERLARNLSVRELAELIDRSISFVALIERGKRGPSWDTLCKFADAFDVSVESLFAADPASVRLDEVYIKRNKINSLLINLNSSQLDFIASVIKQIPIMNNYDVARDDADKSSIDL